jgi:hypothetical protein
MRRLPRFGSPGYKADPVVMGETVINGRIPGRRRRPAWLDAEEFHA